MRGRAFKLQNWLAHCSPLKSRSRPILKFERPTPLANRRHGMKHPAKASRSSVQCSHAPFAGPATPHKPPTESLRTVHPLPIYTSTKNEMRAAHALANLANQSSTPFFTGTLIGWPTSPSWTTWPTNRTDRSHGPAARTPYAPTPRVLFEHPSLPNPKWDQPSPAITDSFPPNTHRTATSQQTKQPTPHPNQPSN